MVELERPNGEQSPNEITCMARHRPSADEKETSMRIVIACAIAVVLSVPATAQEETLVTGDIDHGGFGGPVAKISRVNGENAIFVGGRGGWIINHTFILGGGGYALVPNVRATTPGSTGETQIELAYGGLELEYVGSSGKLLHSSFLLLVGGGAVSYKQADSTFTSTDRSSHGFFIVEPSAHLHVNVTKFFRIAAGLSYRYVAGFSGPQSSNAELSGPAGALTFEFGTS
jgi:hypothetical protein